ncbi:MAG: MMPL family transporter [Sandaracinaceae bacterium]|nr:MMPL family transporter [Sandaracinaceae bacterium]
MIERLFTRLARAQHAQPLLWVLVAFAIAALALPMVGRLELNSDFQAMLPEHAPSVRDLDEIRSRFGGTATLALAIQAEDGASIEDVRAFTRELVPRIEAMEEHQVVWVDWNVADFETFVSDHRHLYAELADLTEIRDSLQARLDYERARANPFYIDLDDDPPPDPEAVIERIRRDAEEAHEQMARFPEGFYQHPELPIVFVFVRTSIRGGETSASDRLIEAIEAAAAEIRHAEPRASRTAGTDVGLVFEGLRIDYGADIMDVREENEALKDAVATSTLVTVVLLLVSIYVFFLRWRSTFLLLATLVPPTLITFGLAEPIVDYLNASSAFLGSIVVGNGVNSSIMWLGRYFEERRSGKDVLDAIERAHLGTWPGTLPAALAAALAYGSLMVTDYRGFRDFGFIGALGLLLCWVAAYAVLPPLVALSERIRPMRFEEREKKLKGVYGVFFARLALGAGGSSSGGSSRPRVVMGVSALLALGAALAIGHAISRDPLEYDFRNLQSVRPPESRVTWVNERVGETVEETRTGSALAILSPTVEEVPHLVEQLVAYREAHPNVIGAVRTMDDLLPHDVDAKIPILVDLRRVMLEVRPHVSDARQADIDANLPPEHLSPIGYADLPRSVAGPFLERDGTRGRLIFVEHGEGQSTWDGRYMREWADAVRSARTAEGHRPAVAGIAVVFADLLGSLYQDGPVTIAFSLGTTIVLLAFSFRRHNDRAYAFLSMLLGALWMTGVLAASGIKLNFLNMVAFPITFGIGLEYGVNYVKRFREELASGKSELEAVRAALEGAGGAVILCSLTTLIGYLSLFVSTNQALNSFGYAMAASEITCLAPAVLTLPALLGFLALRRAATRQDAPPADA